MNMSKRRMEQIIRIFIGISTINPLKDMVKRRMERIIIVIC